MLQDLPELHNGQLHLLLAPHAIRRPLIISLTARLALADTVRVLDGGNSFAVLAIARAIRRQTGELQPALERIQVARAFTCYQMLALLESSGPSPAPTLALELLNTFYDESVPLDERSRLLGTSIHLLRRLSRKTTVLVSADPWAPEGAQELLETLEAACDQAWRFEPMQPPTQLTLF